MEDTKREQKTVTMLKMIQESCGGSDNRSSKRIILYWLTFVFSLMIALQALFTLIVIWKWASNGEGIQVVSVFPSTVWYIVSALIGGLAGINGGESAIKRFGERKVLNNEEQPS